MVTLLVSKLRPFPRISEAGFANGAELSRARIYWRRSEPLTASTVRGKCELQEKAARRGLQYSVTYVLGLKCYPCPRSGPDTEPRPEGAVQHRGQFHFSI